MAALMLAGAKLGDILGRDRTFAVGLAVYALGSFITAISPNLTVLLIGWSLIEGLGAALVIPAIVSLIAATYSGAQRALAFGIVGGVAGAAIAAGPLIGGWVTTELSWRYVFVGEVVIVAVILVVRRRMRRVPPAAARPRLDVVGVALSAAGLGLVVFGILKSSSWGLIEPREGGIELAREVVELLETRPWAGHAGSRAVLAAVLGPVDDAAKLAAIRPGSPSEAVERVGGRDSDQLALARALGAEWLDRYMEEWRKVELEIDGSDLLAAGVGEGPAVGRGLRAALRRKLDGEIEGREQELAVALEAARAG